MKIFKTIHLFMILLLLPMSVQEIYAQHDNSETEVKSSVRFAHLTTEDGLIDNLIEGILKDSRGFLWIGTAGGLNRFDGYRVTSYTHNPDDPNSLSGNKVNDIIEDRRGRLWIASAQDGVSRFDPHTDTFVRYQEAPDGSGSSTLAVFSVFEDNAGVIWFGSGRGELIRVDPDTGTLTTYLLYSELPPGRLGRPPVWEIIAGRAGVFWATASDALVKFNPDTGEATRYAPSGDHEEIRSVYEAPDGALWLTAGALYRFDPNTEQFTRYTVTDAPIVRMMADRSGQLWLGTFEGLFRFDPQREMVTRHYTNHPNEPGSLSSNRIFDLYEDAERVLWIGTQDAGLNRLPPHAHQFTHYRMVSHQPDRQTTEAVTAMTGDESGTLWLSTEKGVYRFHSASEELILSVSPQLSGCPFGIEALTRASSGDVWFGACEYLYHVEETTGVVTGYTPLGEGPRRGPPARLLSIAFDQDGALWVAFWRNGLIRFDRQPETFQRYRPDSANPNSIGMENVTSVYRDMTGGIWAAGPSMLSRFDPLTGQFHNYPVPINEVQDFHEDRTGYLWLAARDGLFRFDRTAETFTAYTEHDGLPGNDVKGILEDDAGNLWLSTTKGLARFDPRTETFRRYDADDGIGGNGFLAGSAWKAADGRLFFGGKHGLTAFYPDRILDNPYQPAVVLTELRLFNEPVSIGEDSLLPQPLWDTDHLTFNHDQSFLSFEFAALSYAAPYKNHYRYRLEGLEEQWNAVDSARRFATYTDLDTGEYVLRVQATNNSGVWSDREVALNIKVRPPWWKTSWFIRFIAALILGTSVSGYSWRVNSIKRRNRLLEVQVAERTHELRESEEKYRNVSERANDGILIVQDGIIKYANPQLTTMGGYLLDALLDQPFDRFVASDQKALIHERYERRLQGNALPSQYETVLLHHDGHRVEVEVNAGIMEYRGCPVILAVIRDITERKRVEATLQQRNLELGLINRTSQTIGSTLDLSHVLQTVLEEMHKLLDIEATSLWLIDEETGELVCQHATGPASGKITGWRLSSDQGLTGYAAQTGEPLITTDTHSDLRHFKELNQQLGLELRSQLNLPLKVRGHVIGVLNLVDEKKERFSSDDLRLLEPVVAAAATAIENARLFNAQQHAKEAALGAQRAAEAANQAKSIFLANMSHELRSPLNAILGFAQVMTRSHTLPPDQIEHLEIITRSGEHLLTLINQVLELSKIEAGRITLDETHVDLYRLLADVEDMFRLRAQEKHVQFLVERSEHVPQYLHTDEVKLRQVLINLLNNALKFTKEGGVMLKVTKVTKVTKVENDDPQSSIVNLQFSISDTGPGIAPEEIGGLFEAFVQTETGRQAREGTGLGLPISRKFVQLMGGDLTVKSEIRKGTTFTFEIQAKLADQSTIDNRQSTISRRIVGLASNQPHYRILVVDDKWTNRHLLMELLQPVGFEVKEAQNGQEALEMWEQWKPHLIWMDMRMPGLDGYEATKRIKAAATGHSTKIIALTASSFEEERTRILSTGCDDYLRKPFRDTELFELMSKHLGVRFVYEEKQEAGGRRRKAEGRRQKAEEEEGLRPEALAALPDEWLANLKQGAEEVDIELLSSIIQQIHERDAAIADVLARLVEDFDYDEILATIQQAKKRR